MISALVIDTSLPSRERGLKFYQINVESTNRMSLPSRERGLKLLFRRLSAWFFHVAPLAGAWIEINIGAKLPDPIRSLPSRERGLKFLPCFRPFF